MSKEPEDLKEYVKNTRESSMLNWYPKIKDLDIPQPKTEILLLNEDEKILFFKFLEDETYPHVVAIMAKLYAKAAKIGYPLFLRSDQGSGKHRWENTCFVDKQDKLIRNIKNLLLWHHEVSLIGLPHDAIVFREYIEMDSKFKAFEGMPICPERRYFIKDGKIVEKFPYWPLNAIHFRSHGVEYEKVENWKYLLLKMNRETPEEIRILTKYAEMVAEVLWGYWSVDFCKALNGKWYLIDMAKGEVSWHPKMDEEKEKQGETIWDEII